MSRLWRRFGARWRAGGSGSRAFPAAAAVVVGMFVVGLLAPFARPAGPPRSDVALAPGASGQGPVAQGPRDEGGAQDLETSGSVPGGDTTPGSAGPGQTGAPGPGSGSGGVAGTPGPGRPGAQGEAGVSASAIRVGVPIMDIAVLSSLGAGDLPTYEEQRDAWDAYWAHHNAAGGMHGRRVEPVYRRTDPLDTDTMRAACEAFVKDDKVFAVVTALGLIADSVRCVSERFGVPLVAALQSPAQYFEQAGGRYFSTLMSLDRQFHAMLQLAHARGFLKGRTIGVITSSGDGEREAGEVLVPALEALGYRVAKHMVHSTDPATGASQTPLEVQQMRAALVDLVVFGESEIAATGFREEARRQGFHPDYVGSDWAFAENTDPTVESPESTILWATFTHAGAAGGQVPRADAQCAQIYERAAGKPLDRASAAPKDRLMYRVVTQSCSVADSFVAAVSRAGAALTRATFTASMQALGPRELANTGPASFRPGKYDAPDAVRAVTVDAACRCWRSQGDFVAL